MSSKKLNNNSFQIKSKHNRTFSEEFRRSKVREIVEKRLTIKELCRLHGVSRQTVYNWIYKYSSAPSTLEWFRQHQSEFVYHMNDLYGICGISRQAHAKAVQREQVLKERDYLYVNFMHEIRRHHPGMGLRKMYEQFDPTGIGRLGLREGLRLRSISNPVRTTDSVKSNRYSNLLGGKYFTDVNQVWSSDIFYFQIGAKHHYVVLIMDVYSRRIVGYSAADNLKAENNIKALQMALTLTEAASISPTIIPTCWKTMASKSACAETF